MKIIKTIILNILISGPLQSMAQVEDVLIPYLQLAAENNPELNFMFDNYLAALEKIDQNGTLPDPQVAFGYFIQPVETRVGAQRANLSVTQMFPWFGTLSARERAAAEMAEVQLRGFEDARARLYREIRKTYNELYYLEKSVEISQENLIYLESLKELARIAFEGGNGGLTNVLRVEMEEEELQNRLRFLEDSRKPLFTRFERLINSHVDSLDIPETLWTETLFYARDLLFDSIISSNPRIEALVHQADAYDHQQVVARKMGSPSFSVGANYINIAPRTDVEMAGNGKDALLFPQVGITIPIYRKKYKAMENEAVLQTQAAEHSVENLENQLLTELESLLRDYDDAVRRVTLYMELADYARRTLDLLQSEFSTGKADFEAVINMERKLLNYRLELEKARVDRNNSIYDINYLMGI